MRMVLIDGDIEQVQALIPADWTGQQQAVRINRVRAPCNSMYLTALEPAFACCKGLSRRGRRCTEIRQVADKTQE